MRNKWIVLIGLLLCISALLVACAQPAEPPAVEEAPAEEVAEEPEEEAKPAAPEFIEVGASIPITGKFGSLGGMVLPGYEYAVQIHGSSSTSGAGRKLAADAD